MSEITFFLTSALYTCIFLVSIYAFGGIRSRGLPQNIKYRIVGSSFSLLVILSLILQLHKAESHQEMLRKIETFNWASLYITCKNFLASIIYAIVINEVLYFGEWFHFVVFEKCLTMAAIKEFVSDILTIRGLRNYLVAPLHEEFVFRAAIIYQAKKYFSGVHKISALAALIFSMAHMHHIFEDYLDGVSIKVALVCTVVQMSYTFVFGYLASFVLQMTGNLAAPVVLHILCNLHGTPSLISALEYHKNSKRRFLLSCVTLASYIAGVFGCLYILQGGPLL